MTRETRVLICDWIALIGVCGLAATFLYYSVPWTWLP